LSVGDGFAAQGLGPRPLLVAALKGLSRLSHLIRWVTYRNLGFRALIDAGSKSLARFADCFVWPQKFLSPTPLTR
jgi:hypothetical protein